MLISLNGSGAAVPKLFPEGLVKNHLKPIRTWELPGGGRGESYLIDDVLVNRFSMKRMAGVLRGYARELPDLATYICTSKRAAHSAEAWSLEEDLPEDELARFREHFVALYTWVEGDGVDSFVWSRRGLNRGTVISIPPGT